MSSAVKSRLKLAEQKPHNHMYKTDITIPAIMATGLWSRLHSLPTANSNFTTTDHIARFYVTNYSNHWANTSSAPINYRTWSQTTAVTCKNVKRYQFVVFPILESLKSRDYFWKCDAVVSGIMLPPCSMSKSFSLTTSHGTAHFSETSVDFYHTTGYDIPDDGNLHVKIHFAATNMLSFWQHEPAAFYHCHSVSSYCPCHLAEIQKLHSSGLLLSEQR